MPTLQALGLQPTDSQLTSQAYGLVKEPGRSQSQDTACCVRSSNKRTSKGADAVTRDDPPQPFDISLDWQMVFDGYRWWPVAEVPPGTIAGAGQWQWTGNRWVPAPAPQTQARPLESSSPITPASPYQSLPSEAPTPPHGRSNDRAASAGVQSTSQGPSMPVEEPHRAAAYRPGDTANGHVLGADGQWHQLQAAPPTYSGRPTPVPLRFDPKSRLFQGSLGQVMRLAMQAVQRKGWTVVQANETLGFLVFETKMSMGSWSGVTCTLTFQEVSPTWWRVSGSGKQNVRGGQLLAMDLGEAGRKAAKAVAMMASLAPR